MAKKESPAVQDTAPTFEELLDGLDAIVRALEAGQLGLTDSLARYEEGIGNLKRCYQMLDQAEKKVALITGTRPDGEPILQAIDDESGSLEEKAQKRGERRSHP